MNGNTPDVAMSEAAYQVVIQLARTTETPWSQTDPHAAELYIATRSTTALTPAVAREFEISGRALFALAHGRWPDTFAELATYLDARLP